MKKLLAAIGIVSHLDYQMDDFPSEPIVRPLALAEGEILSDKQKCQPKAQREFIVKGVKIMAASKKDAIKKYNHRKK